MAFTQIMQRCNLRMGILIKMDMWFSNLGIQGLVQILILESFQILRQIPSFREFLTQIRHLQIKGSKGFIRSCKKEWCWRYFPVKTLTYSFCCCFKISQIIFTNIVMLKSSWKPRPLKSLGRQILFQGVRDK